MTLKSEFQCVDDYDENEDTEWVDNQEVSRHIDEAMYIGFIT
jgi:hypothetical protein